MGSVGSPITVQPTSLTDVNPIDLPVLNLSTCPLLTPPARLQIASNNITYRINLRGCVRGLWKPLISVLMSWPFINFDLFNIGMPRHPGRQSCSRLSLVGSGRVHGKPVRCHRCRYSCSLLTIRLLRPPEMKSEMTGPGLSSWPYIPSQMHWPFMGIQFFIKKSKKQCLWGLSSGG